jgi:hypothetical protein
VYESINEEHEGGLGRHGKENSKREWINNEPTDSTLRGQDRKTYLSAMGWWPNCGMAGRVVTRRTSNSIPNHILEMIHRNMSGGASTKLLQKIQAKADTHEVQLH